MTVFPQCMPWRDSEGMVQEFGWDADSSLPSGEYWPSWIACPRHPGSDGQSLDMLEVVRPSAEG